ncbi:MAG: hypothetical protein IPG80_14580 [Anaerolineales bacterium]|uniref:hypothetical protein n=1 Tax=Candidatus Villigracilis vicinus TaxID=3140679 RepID=UPI003136F0E4|nr:hypothetical protein [Anaerolineales bacterium]
MQTRNALQEILLRSIFVLTIVFILISCQLNPSATADPATVDNSSNESVEDFPPLPATFQTNLLNPLDTPHTYLNDTCRSLRYKWNPINSEPGTVVMVILIKNINRGTTEIPDSIRILEFFDLMEMLKAQGFDTIDTNQLHAFLQRNAAIPPRSVLLIQDGNQSEEYFDKNFREYFERWGWTVTNAWVSEPEIDPVLLEGNVSLEEEGFVNHQARGVTPDTILSDDVAKTIIARELQGSLNGLVSFNKFPNAIIWPNGGFGYRPVDAARQLRFRLGFTQNPRGPIMYNWIPLADAADPERPGLIPEGRINDPVMTIPMYSANEAINAIDTVRAISKAAAEYTLANKETEFEYYNTVCAEKYGPLPTP